VCSDFSLGALEVCSLLHNFYFPLFEQAYFYVVEEAAHGYVQFLAGDVNLGLVQYIIRSGRCNPGKRAYYVLEVEVGLALEGAVLLDYYGNEGLQWLEELVIPALDLSELLYTEVQELGPQLRLQEVFQALRCLDVDELEPKRHYLVVEMWARLDEFDAEVFGRLATERGSSNLHLLLDQFLLLLFELAYEVVS
jgi:hypothetical protein